MKYDTLLKILDQIRAEATAKHGSRYLPDANDIEKINQARSRAFIHLYLKVMFGLLTFEERERLITDGAYDGGIDGYFINADTRSIYLLQSKFRTSRQNFEQKDISLDELLRMDISRILKGEEFDLAGNEYNGKIKQLQREIRQIPDIARYSYNIVILANLKGVPDEKLKLFTDGLPAIIFDYDKCYELLVFPVISGTFFKASDIFIPIDLSNKNAGSKISYTVKTKYCDCEITVLFVPAIEIAKIMHKYKNTILAYNPRSYLEFEGQSVNKAIRETIVNTTSNEFALFNNGITILSDDTNINEKIGQKNKAQLMVKNPQIINGGQTSYTLSRILEDKTIGDHEAVFQDKEVLLKVITLIDSDNHSDKVNLIDAISNATNKQTPVINADRFANDEFHQNIQKTLFNLYGLLYERKRGEFADGLSSNYIQQESIIERNLFLRIFYSSNGKIHKGCQKRLFQKNQFADFDLTDLKAFKNFRHGLNAFTILSRDQYPGVPLNRVLYAKIYAYALVFSDFQPIDDLIINENNIKFINEHWKKFIKDRKDHSTHGRHRKLDKMTGEFELTFSESRYLHTGPYEEEISEYFSGLSYA
jgi:hypothetical protein